MLLAFLLRINLNKNLLVRRDISFLVAKGLLIFDLQTMESRKYVEKEKLELSEIERRSIRLSHLYHLYYWTIILLSSHKLSSIDSLLSLRSLITLSSIVTTGKNHEQINVNKPGFIDAIHHLVSALDLSLHLSSLITQLCRDYVYLSNTK